MIRIDHLTFAFTGRPLIFENFSLSVEQGGFWAIIGPSGCGKSTLLYLLAGLRKPLAGKMTIAGREISRPRPETGLILQDHGLLPWANVWENARLGLKIRDYYGPDGLHAPKAGQQDRAGNDSRVEQWLKDLGIFHLKEKYPAQLSRGERQRTAIARTLSLNPDLLLMDEPFSALDEPTREEIRGLIGRCQRESGMTVVLVTHDIDEAILVGEKILILTDKLNVSPLILENSLAYQEDCQRLEEFALFRETLKAHLEGAS